MGRSFNAAGGGVTPFEGQEILSAFPCPVLQAAVNDYVVAVRGFANASLLLIGATVPLNITGLQGATANRRLTLLNSIGAGAAVTLKNANAGSAVANRFNFGADVILNHNQSIELLGLEGGGWVVAGALPASSAGAPATATYVTVNNESVALPNSVQLANAGIAASVALELTDHSIANEVATAIPFDTVITDVHGLWASAAPTRLTAPVAGVYLVSATAAWYGPVSAIGAETLQFRKNGAGPLYGYSSIPSVTTVNSGNSVSVILPLAAGDYVEAMAFQNSGAALNVSGAGLSQPTTTFSMMAIH